MRRLRLSGVLAVMVMAGACAKKNEQTETPPADTAATAPMPMDTAMMQMDSAAHDSMLQHMSTTTQ